MFRARSAPWLVPCLALGCQLLTPYPGGGDPAKALGSGKRLEGGDEREPLVDPAVDPSITLWSLAEEPVLAIPGTAFPVELGFTAPQRNVVGGGIRFPGSDEVQWTFISGVEEEQGPASIQFGYVVAQDVCDDIPNLCHEIETEQFAVARNVAPGQDVDGDGKPDGEFVVSQPERVTVVLICATCDSKSCQQVLPKGKCQQCGQPQVCRDYHDRCLAEGKPNAETKEADLFDTFFGPQGVLWTVATGCAAGEKACEDAQRNAEAEPDVCEL
jgi:hypothetical protein